MLYIRQKLPRSDKAKDESTIWVLEELFNVDKNVPPSEYNRFNFPVEI